MKKIILIRHGKSSWEYDVSDIERPLKPRGIKDSRLIAEAFELNKLENLSIYSSPANRAYSTCKIFANIINYPLNEVEIIEDLYDFGGSSVINFVKSLSDSKKNVMIFGHNHAFTSISNIFGDKFIDNLPTAGLVVLNFDISSWKDLKKGKTELMLFPRDFKK
jgi:phosphohistidine phosphatase